MGTSLLSDNNNGRALNADHITMTVDGIREDVPEGWIERREVPVVTDYGYRVDIEYIYPDGAKVTR